MVPRISQLTQPRYPIISVARASPGSQERPTSPRKERGEVKKSVRTHLEPPPPFAGERSDCAAIRVRARQWVATSAGLSGRRHRAVHLCLVFSASPCFH